jgi:hypothetical protein
MQLRLTNEDQDEAIHEGKDSLYRVQRFEEGAPRPPDILCLRVHNEEKVVYEYNGNGHWLDGQNPCSGNETKVYHQHTVKGIR